jgi:hypothetical protein
VIFNCFAYSCSGTPNFLAIATCEGVSLTTLRPTLAVDLDAEATFCTAVFIGLVLVVPNLWGKSTFILRSISHNIHQIEDHNPLLLLVFGAN